MPAPEAAPASTVSRFEPWSAARLALELELYTRAQEIRRAGADLSELRLDRGELGGRVQLGPSAAAELRLEAIRSAMDGGSLGIAGDSTVVRVKYAQVMGTHGFGDRDGAPLVRVDGALGFVPDPWLRTLETDYTVKPLSRTGSERLLGWPASDLSALVRAAVGPARATVSVGNGEGLAFPERNNGKTTTAVVEVVPITTDVLRLTMSGVVRDGSIGIASIRDRRYGGGITAVTPWVRAGVELVRAQGIGDQGGLSGTLVGGWADARIIEHVFAAVRGSTVGFANRGGRESTFGGALAIEPWHEAGARARGNLRLWLAIDRTTTTGGAMPLPGADAGDATTIMLIASAIARFVIE